MPQWLIGVITWSAIIGLIACGIIRRRRNDRRCREAFLARRGEPMDDDTVLQHLNVESPPHRRFCLACRRAVAAEVDLPTELIYPHDPVGELAACFRVDILGIPIVALQEEIGREPNLMQRYEHDADDTGPLCPERPTLGEYLHWYVEHWQPLTA